MPRVCVAPAVAERLHELRSAPGVPDELRAELEDAWSAARMDGDAPADVCSAPPPVRVSHALLEHVAEWAGHEPPYTLEALLRGASLYFEPPPKYQRVCGCSDAAPRAR